MVSDSFALKNNNKALRADFLLPTQAFVGDTVVCLDITKPVPDRVLWETPPSVYIIEENFSRLRSVATQTGNLLFKMTASNGECQYTVNHFIEIKEKKYSNDDVYNTEQKGIIKEISIKPNPSDGRFKLVIELIKSIDVTVQIIRNIGGQTVYEWDGKNKLLHEIDIVLNQVTGLYLLTISSGQERVTHRILINR